MNYDGEVKVVGGNVSTTDVTIDPYRATVTGTSVTNQRATYGTNNSPEPEVLDFSVNGDSNYIVYDKAQHVIEISAIDFNNGVGIIKINKRMPFNEVELIDTINVDYYLLNSLLNLGFSREDIYRLVTGEISIEDDYCVAVMENHRVEQENNNHELAKIKVSQESETIERSMVSGLTDYDGNPIPVSSFEELQEWVDDEKERLKNLETDDNLGFMYKCFVTGEETYPCGNDEVLRWVTTYSDTTEINVANNLYGSTGGLEALTRQGVFTIYAKIVPGDVSGEVKVVGYYISTDKPPKPRGPYDSQISFDDYMKVNADVYAPILEYIELPTEGNVIKDTTVDNEYTARMEYLDDISKTGYAMERERDYYINYEYKLTDPYYERFNYWNENFDTSFMDDLDLITVQSMTCCELDTSEENVLAIYGFLSGADGFDTGNKINGVVYRFYRGMPCGSTYGVGMFDQFFCYYDACTPEMQEQIKRTVKIVYNQSGVDGLYDYFYAFIEHNYNMIPALEQARLEAKDSLLWDTLGLIPDKFFDGIETLRVAGAELENGRDDIYQFVPNNTYEMRKQIMSEIIVERYGEAAGQWYDFGVGAMEFGVQIAASTISTVLTGTPIFGLLPTVGLNSFSDTYKSASARGLPPGACWGEALVASTVECYFSNLAMNTMIKGESLLAAGLSEAGEETFSMVVNELVDVCLFGGENSTRALAIKQYMDSGYTETEAIAMYNNSFFDSILKTAGLSFAMGFLFKGGINIAGEAYVGIKNVFNSKGIDTNKVITLAEMFSELDQKTRDEILTEYENRYSSEGGNWFENHLGDLEVIVDSYWQAKPNTTMYDYKKTGKRLPQWASEQSVTRGQNAVYQFESINGSTELSETKALWSDTLENDYNYDLSSAEGIKAAESIQIYYEGRVFQEVDNNVYDTIKSYNNPSAKINIESYTINTDGTMSVVYTIDGTTSLRTLSKFETSEIFGKSYETAGLDTMDIILHYEENIPNVGTNRSYKYEALVNYNSAKEVVGHMTSSDIEEYEATWQDKVSIDESGNEYNFGFFTTEENIAQYAGDGHEIGYLNKQDGTRTQWAFSMSSLKTNLLTIEINGNKLTPDMVRNMSDVEIQHLAEQVIAIPKGSFDGKTLVFVAGDRDIDITNMTSNSLEGANNYYSAYGRTAGNLFEADVGMVDINDSEIAKLQSDGIREMFITILS